MGRRAIPTNLHILHGNPSKKALGSLFDGSLRPPVAIPKCPDHFSVEAKTEWRRITKHLEPLGLISEIDRAALSGYCTAWGDYVWAERRMAELNSGSTTGTGEAGRIGETLSGYKQISVHMQIRNRALELMVKFLNEFGMSPAARSRVSPSDPQLTLAGMDKAHEGGWANL
jgi:P27 family predicted phage terminase small subunit